MLAKQDILRLSEVGHYAGAEQWEEEFSFRWRLQEDGLIAIGTETAGMQV
jgi:hypothetical protein